MFLNCWNGVPVRQGTGRGVSYLEGGHPEARGSQKDVTLVGTSSLYWPYLLAGR